MVGRYFKIADVLNANLYNISDITNIASWMQGNQYWRFDGDVMDEDYPRNISTGFDGVPDGVNAAFALPAPSHRGKEKAYFFKGTVLRNDTRKNKKQKILHNVINHHQKWNFRILRKKIISNCFCSHHVMKILPYQKFKVHEIKCDVIKIHDKMINGCAFISRFPCFRGQVLPVWVQAPAVTRGVCGDKPGLTVAALYAVHWPLLWSDMGGLTHRAIQRPWWGSSLSIICILLCPCVCFSNQRCLAYLVSSPHTGSRLTMQDWHGIRPPVDATMVGRVIPARKATSTPRRGRWGSRKKKPSRKQRRRQSRFVDLEDFWGYDDSIDDYLESVGTARPQHQSTPVQNVYFFKKGMNKGPNFSK